MMQLETSWSSFRIEKPLLREPATGQGYLPESEVVFSGINNPLTAQRLPWNIFQHPGCTSLFPPVMPASIGMRRKEPPPFNPLSPHGNLHPARPFFPDFIAMPFPALMTGGTAVYNAWTFPATTGKNDVFPSCCMIQPEVKVPKAGRVRQDPDWTKQGTRDLRPALPMRQRG